VNAEYKARSSSSLNDHDDHYDVLRIQVYGILDICIIILCRYTYNKQYDTRDSQYITVAIHAFYIILKY